MNNTDILASITVDEEFENLIKPISALEKHRLTIDVRTRQSAHIRIWNNIVLCDSELLGICREYPVPCSIITKEFQSRNEAMIYVCEEQLKRDDLTSEYRRYLIGKRYILEVKRNTNPKNTKVAIASQVAEQYFMSAGAIQKYGQYAEALDSVFAMVPEAASFVLNSKVRISQECTSELARLPKEELAVLVQTIKEKPNARMTFSEIKHEIRWKNYTASTKTKPRKPKEENLEIRKIPKYDPDAAMSSLSLTIPSWISSIKQAMERTHLSETSLEGRYKLKDQLYALDDEILRVIQLMEV